MWEAVNLFHMNMQFPCAYCRLRACIQAVILSICCPLKSFPALCHSSMFPCPLPVPFWLSLHVKKTKTHSVNSVTLASEIPQLGCAHWARPPICIHSGCLNTGASLSICRWKWEREIFPVLPHQSIVAFFLPLPESPGDFAKTSGMSMSDLGS